MAEKNDSLKFKQIKVLICVLGAGLGAGILMAMLMLHYYNPTGTYLVKNVLLDPENAYALRYVEPSPKGNSDNRYVLEGAYFSYYDPQRRMKQSIPLSKKKYEEFYHLIADEKSLVEADKQIEGLFNQPTTAALTLKVRRTAEDASKGIDSVFSRVDFAYEGNYYRIQIRQSAPGNEWAYFYHPGIYREMTTLIND